MDSKQVTTIILTIVVSGIIAPFSKVIFEKIFAAYSPDPKKINSGIKKTFRLTLRYILPIANLTYLYLTHKEVDKFLILSTGFITFILTCNVCVDIMMRLLDKLFFNESSLFNSHFKLIKSIIQVADMDREKTIEALNAIADKTKQYNSTNISHDDKQQPT